MKVSNWRRRISASLIAAGLMTPPMVRAMDIPLDDPSFEAYVVPQSGSFPHYAYSDLYRPVCPWVDDQDMPTQDDGQGNWLYDAAYAEGSVKRAAPRSGNQAMNGRYGYSTQEIPQFFEAGKTYTFSIYAQAIPEANAEAGEASVKLYIASGVPYFTSAGASASKEFSLHSGDFLARPMDATAEESRDLWRAITLSHTVYEDAPEAGQPITVGFWSGPDADLDDASLSVDTTILTLEVNAATGAMQIVNETGQPVSIDSYSIKSASGSIDAANWLSLQKQNLPSFPAGDGSGNGWEETPTPDTALIGESFSSGASELAAANAISLGNAYAVGGVQDLYFKYGHTTATSLQADFDSSGMVDGNDFLVWQRSAGAAGSTVTSADGDANGDLSVDPADLAIWQSEYGDQATSSGSNEFVRGFVRYVTPAGVAAPEPSAIVVACMGLLAAARCGQRRGASR
jgi:hypothetical protein